MEFTYSMPSWEIHKVKSKNHRHFSSTRITAEPAEHSCHLIFHLLNPSEIQFLMLSVQLYLGWISCTFANPSRTLLLALFFSTIINLAQITFWVCSFFCAWFRMLGYTQEIHKIILLDYIFHEIMCCLLRTHALNASLSLSARRTWRVIKFGLNRCSSSSKWKQRGVEQRGSKLFMWILYYSTISDELDWYTPRGDARCCFV